MELDSSALDPVALDPIALDPIAIVTCEHASNTFPAEIAGELDLKNRETHEIYDIGAIQLAIDISRQLSLPIFSGKFSRLAIDLNRSLTHDLVSQVPSFQTDQKVKGMLIDHYNQFRSDVSKTVDSMDPCIHLSIHSFTRVFSGKTRQVDIGILFDPASYSESNFASQLAKTLGHSKYNVKMNEPYLGTDDGHTTHLRGIHSPHRYAGIEIEVCNDLFEKIPKEISKLLVDSLRGCIRKDIFDPEAQLNPPLVKDPLHSQ